MPIKCLKPSDLLKSDFELYFFLFELCSFFSDLSRPPEPCDFLMPNGPKIRPKSYLNFNLGQSGRGGRETEGRARDDRGRTVRLGRARRARVPGRSGHQAGNTKNKES